MGIGSVLGALVAGARGRVSNRLLVVSSGAFGAFILVLALAPTIEVAAAALVPLGAASVTFAAGVNSSLQLAAAPGMRGRVLALYSIVFLGSTPIGAPLVGWLAEVAGPRSGLFAGAAAAFVAAAYARWAYAKHPGARPAELGGRGARRGDREAKHGDQAGDSTGVAARLGDHRVDQHHEQRAGGEPIERRARLARDRIGDRLAGDGGDHAGERDGDPEAHDRRSPSPRRVHRAR
jgi:MFS family permease